jgi:signal transduction histidine kinase
VISLRRALTGIGVLGVFAIAGAEWAILSSDHQTLRGVVGGVGGFIAASWIFAGLFAWWRRPRHPMGVLMTATGFLWCLNGSQSASDPFLFTVAATFGTLFAATALHMLLAITRQGPPSRGERAIVLMAYASTTLLAFPAMLFADSQRYACDNCPDNVFLISNNHTAADALFGLSALVGGLSIVAALVLIIRRVRAYTPPQRRVYAPVLYAGAAQFGLLAIEILLSSVGLSDSAVQPFDLLAALCFGALPLIFVAGLLRSSVRRAGQVGELVASLGEAPAHPPARLRDLLADALGDRDLDLAYWLPGDERWIDAEGRPFELPAPGGRRAVLEIEQDGERIGAVVHDAALLEHEPELLRAIGAAAGLSLENERLAAELRASLEEVRASRARIVEAGDRERRRLERNLHDGAQQRLVALSLALGVARNKVSADPGAAERLIESAQGELQHALSELRELARGIHPALLADHGLGPAVETLAGRSPVPVEVSIATGERLPEPVEAAAYFVVAEALTNVAKYAGAEHASVRVARDNGSAVIEVSDDGVGGADPAGGSGLRGLADRVAALDGRLTVASRNGTGTTIVAEIPCV